MEIKAPRGTHDILPDESGAWQAVEEKIRARCALFGYGEIRTPVFEQTNVFARGVGDTTDIVQKEMYTFSDKGGRSMTLRPENTAGVVRAFLEHKLYAQTLPAKLYYLSAPMFRYENPQAGRYRQFYQFGVEVFGAPSAACDAEVIELAWGLLKSLGVEKLSLHVNSIGCPICRPAYQEKLRDYFGAHADELCPTCRERLARNPLRILDCKSEVCHRIALDAPKMLDNLCPDCADHFETLRACLAAVGIGCEIDTMIVRGLDYYTRTVFEIVSEDIGAQGTVCGGGRYDGLMKLMGGPELAGVGFAFGMERLLIVMKALGVLPEASARTDAYVAAVPETPARVAAYALCSRLREAGFNAECDYAGRGLRAQIKCADKLGARTMIAIGPDELERGVVSVRDMTTGDEIKAALDSAADTVKSMVASARPS